MEIKASSTYDFETVQALMRLNMFQKADPRKRMRTWFIVATILLALLVFDFIAFGSSSILWTLLFVLIMCAFLYAYLYFGLPKLRYKAMGKFAGIHNRFVFRGNDMSVASSIDDYQGSTSLKYTMLFKAMETSTHFFLFQNKLNAYIVNKSTIDGGTAEDIRNALIAVLEKQYIICKY